MQNLQDIIRETARLIREAHQKTPGPSFIAEYRKLVDQMFPGGYAGAFQQIQAGDSAAIEFGLVFTEVQPYYFRSQYHRTQLIRKLKHAALSSSQAARLKRILELEHEKKTKRKPHA